MNDLGFDPDRPPRFFSAVVADVEAHQGRNFAVESPARRAYVVVRIFFRSPGFRMTLLHRAAYSLRAALGPVGWVVGSVFYWFIRHFYGCSIATTAHIQGGIIFPHPQGIVIGPGVRLGPRAWVFQNVTIGGSPGREGLPTIGADARIYAGAVLAGPIVVGREVVVGANAVVTIDLPVGSVARSPSLEVRTPGDRVRPGPSADLID